MGAHMGLTRSACTQASGGVHWCPCQQPKGPPPCLERCVDLQAGIQQLLAPQLYHQQPAVCRWQ